MLFKTKSFLLIPPKVINFLKLLCLNIVLNNAHLLMHLFLLLLPLVDLAAVGLLVCFDLLFHFYLLLFVAMDQNVNLFLDLGEVVVVV